ncbi:hypothetical protein ABT133_22075 [Streptomyces sp. NPDC001835]|uniref:hypothetical protein n=1 Tax=Streptomyces sp. NPDC001835 TaxID=3154528 RepID=UPI00331F241C
MHSNEETRRTTGGLSTGDLAQPAGAPTEDERGATASRAPIYPGEGTTRTGTEPMGGDTGAADHDTGAPAPGGSEAAGATAEPAGDTAAARGAGAAAEAARAPGASEDESPQLLTDGEEQGFRDRWQTIQGKFVDDPREAVHDADALVADVMRTLATTFDQHKKDLEGQWSQGERVDTEELRGALRRYRSFFNRLLST